jgi:hypothetical protein
LLGEQTLQVIYAVEVGSTAFELQLGQFHGPLGVVHTASQKLCPLLSVQESRQAVFDFLAGLEHGLLIVKGDSLKPRVLGDNVIRNSPVVQHVPGKPGDDVAGKTSRFEQFIDVVGQEAQVAIQRQRGI